MASVYTNMFCTFLPQASFRSIHEVEVRNKYIIKDFEWCGGKCYEPDRSVSFFLFFGGIWLEVTLQGLLVFFHIAANFWCKGTIKWKLFNLQNNSFGILCFEISISSEEKTALELEAAERKEVSDKIVEVRKISEELEKKGKVLKNTKLF